VSIQSTDPDFVNGLNAGQESFYDTYDVDALPTTSEILVVIRENTSPSWLQHVAKVARLSGLLPPSPAFRAGFLLGWLRTYTSAMVEANYAA
jgi:hypothetical protein